MSAPANAARPTGVTVGGLPSGVTRRFMASTVQRRLRTLAYRSGAIIPLIGVFIQHSSNCRSRALRLCSPFFIVYRRELTRRNHLRSGFISYLVFARFAVCARICAPLAQELYSSYSAGVCIGKVPRKSGLCSYLADIQRALQN